jgi:hypothetical protein
VKVELIQGVCPGATGNYDFTGSTPSGDMVGAIFFISGAAANNNNNGSLRWALGATDLSGNINVGIGAQDATAGAGIRSMLSNTNCLTVPNGVGAQAAPVGAYSATLSTGVRLTTSTVNANRLTDCLLISGTDVVMKVGSQLFATSDMSKSITHGLGGTPDLIILLCSFGQSVNEGDGTGFSMGFWDRTTTNQSSVSFRATTGANPTDQAAYASSNHAGQILAAASSSADVTLTSIGSTTFTITLSSAADATNKYFGWIALRGTTQLFTKNILTAIPTSTGNSTIISGMSGRPQAYLAIPTRLVTSDAIVTDDSSGSFGTSVSATNNYSSTTTGGVSGTYKDNVATSVARNMISNTIGVLSQDNAGALDVQGTVNSWDVGGVTVNYTNVGATLRQMAVLAFGAQTPQTVFIPRHIFRPVNTIYYPR